jgi:hypothetical protein
MLIHDLRICTMVLALGTTGCSMSHDPAPTRADPEAEGVLQTHWKALQRKDWRSAYDMLHPDIKSKGLTLKRFIALHARRRDSLGFPHDLKVAGSKPSDDSIAVSYDLFHLSPEGGEPFVVPPRREAILRRAGGSWRLVTHDILTAGGVIATAGKRP